MGLEQSFLTLLQAFKSPRAEQDVSEGMLPFIDDKELRHGLVAWQSMIVEYDPDKLCPHADAKHQWQWLWENVRFDMSEFAVVANVRDYDAKALFERLKALRLIYPDGTLNSIARGYMRRFVQSKIPELKRRVEKKEDKQDAVEQQQENAP